MSTRNYYVVLGVARTESQHGIRRAYKDLAQRYHPDRAGPKSTPLFQEIVAAYRVLSDPQRRAIYDEGLRSGPGGDPPRAARVWPEPRPEPLVPQRDSLMRDFWARSPSREEIRDRILRNFELGWAPKADRPEPLRLELVIPATDAVHGGIITVMVPVFYPCARCRGTGLRGAHGCERCEGAGVEQVDEPARLRVPPGVRDGEVFVVPLRGLGIHNLYLSICVRVGR